MENCGSNPTPYLCRNLWIVADSILVHLCSMVRRLLKSILGLNAQSENVTKLPKVDLAILFPEFKSHLRLMEAASVNGNVTIYELFAISFAASACAPTTVFEVGTFDGRTTLNLAVNCPSTTRIFTLDLPASGLLTTKFPLEEYDKGYVEKQKSGTRFEDKPEGQGITQLLGDSGKFDFAPYFNTIDFVFVDGSHAYDYVLNDSMIALKLLRNGRGTILWHDYGNACWPGVARALDELWSTNPQFCELKHIQDTTIACLRVC